MLTHWTAAGFDPDAFWAQTFGTFNAAMLGAAKRTNMMHQLVIAGAYAGECFAREKRLKKLPEYLPKPILTEQEERAERDAGARSVLAMIRRMKAQQEANGGKSNIKIRKVKRNG